MERFHCTMRGLWARSYCRKSRSLAVRASDSLTVASYLLNCGSHHVARPGRMRGMSCCNPLTALWETYPPALWMPANQACSSFRRKEHRIQGMSRWKAVSIGSQAWHCIEQPVQRRLSPLERTCQGTDRRRNTVLVEPAVRLEPRNTSSVGGRKFAHRLRSARSPQSVRGSSA